MTKKEVNLKREILKLKGQTLSPWEIDEKLKERGFVSHTDLLSTFNIISELINEKKINVIKTLSTIHLGDLVIEITELYIPE